MEMDLTELESHIAITLQNLFLKYRKINLVRGVSVQFIVDDFGVIICGINRPDYVQVDTAINSKYPGWRTVYLTTHDRINDKRYEILWALMRGGYMRWIRSAYPGQVKKILTGPDNLGTRIIKERLRIWGDQPKHRFMVEDNKAVLANGILREFTRDQGFFDYMPEEE